MYVINISQRNYITRFPIQGALDMNQGLSDMQGGCQCCVVFSVSTRVAAQAQMNRS
jgi:hypothetical protein